MGVKLGMLGVVFRDAGDKFCIMQNRVESFPHNAKSNVEWFSQKVLLTWYNEPEPPKGGRGIADVSCEK